MSYGLLEASFEVAMQPQMSSHVLQALPAPHPGLPPSMPPQQAPQQAPQQQHMGMSAPLASPPPQQQQLPPPAQQPQPLSARQSQWVLLPRHLVEQQAPQLLGAAVPASRAAVHQAQSLQPEQPQQLQQPQMHQAQQLQAVQASPQQAPPQHQQHQQHGQQQQAQQQQPGWPVKVDVGGGALVDAPSFNLYFGELGGSGI